MKRLTEQLTAFAATHRTLVLAVLLLPGLLSALSLFRIKFTNDVSRMFPDSRDAGTTFRILNETKLGNTVQVEFIAPDSIEKYEKYLDGIAEKLTRLPKAGSVTFRYRTHDMFQELTALTALIPRFFSPDVLEKCDADPAVKKAMKQLAFPVPGGVRMLRNQPFGLEQEILAGLRLLDEMAGTRLAPDLPYFAARDKRRAMIVFNADIRIGDADSVRKLLGELRSMLEPLPEGMQYRIVSGIMHTLGNEEILKRDAMISCSVSLALFLLIFLVFYRRDWRTLWIPAVPLYASLLSLGIMTLFFREICLYVIGLGSCITGLAIDQGIHVYAAYHGEDAVRRTAALTEPMMLSAATSILVFLFLAFTGIHAYIQLAVFAGLSLAFSCVMALTVLPLFLNREQRMTDLKPALPKRKIPLFLPLLLLPAALFCGKILLKNSNFTLESLDGTPREIRMQEEDFNAAWKTPGIRTAVLAASGKNADEALTRLLNFIEGRNHIRSRVRIAVPPVPPQSLQQANREKWRTAETAEKINLLERQTREACKKNGLPEKFFLPFFSQLRNSVASDDFLLPPILKSIGGKMIREYGGRASALALAADDGQTARIIRKELKESGNGHCALLSKEGFRQMIREDLSSRFLRILPLSLLSAFLLAYAVFRKISDVLLAMTPVYISFCGLFILGALTGFQATPAAAFALILLAGLSIDYGIYAVSQLRHPDQISIRGSIFLSAATTVAGAGALVFSKHPALYGTGIVLSVGIALACAGGLWLVPMLKKDKTAALLPALLALLLPTGCISGVRLEDFPEAENIKHRMKLFPETGFKVQAGAGIKIHNREHTFILTANLNPESGRLKAAGISSAGTLIFQLDGNKIRLGTGVPEQMRKSLDALRQDLAAIFFTGNGKQLYVKKGKDCISITDEDGNRWELYPDRIIREKASFPFRSWRCEYRNNGREILYLNRKRDSVIRLKIYRIL